MRTTRPTTLKRKAMLAAVTGLMAVGVASPAFAVKAGGGDWYYGVSVCCNWSEYHHSSTKHGASVKNSTGLVRSDCMDAGKTARASQSAAISGNQAFWRHC